MARVTVEDCIDKVTPIPYLTTYGFWVAILAYIVLAVGNVVKT